MTDKRFTIFGEWHKDNVIDEIRDNTGEFVTIGRCVDLLNENEQLKGELDYWKKRALLLEKKYDEGDRIKWLRENTVWEQMPTNIKTKIKFSLPSTYQCKFR